MKKIIYGVSFLALVGIGFVACKKDNLSNPALSTVSQSQSGSAKSYNRGYVNPYEFIGEIHNIVLRTALTDLTYHTLSNSDKIIYITNQVNRELTIRGMETLSSSDMVNVFHFDTQIPDLNRQTPEAYYDSNVANLSDAEKSIMAQLKADLDQYGVDHNEAQLIGKKELLESTVNSTIPVGKQGLMLGAISLGTNSAVFWVTEGTSASPNGFKIKPWLADVGGFVGGVFGTLAWNNNNGTAQDTNPFTVGAAVATAASAAAKAN